MVTQAQRDEVAQAAFSRLERAMELGQDLLNRVDHWRMGNPERPELTIASDRKSCVLQVSRFEPELNLTELGLQLGEVAGHMRGLLNTMLSRIWEFEGLERSKRLQYPVCRKRSEWRDARKVVGKLPERVVRLLYAGQPFVRTRMHGRPSSADVLSVLAWLDNEAKHHIELRPDISVNLDEFRAELLVEQPAGAIRVIPDGREVLRRDEVGRTVIDVSPDRIVELGRLDLWVMTEVVFVDEDGMHTDVRTLLWELLQTVKRMIVETLTVWKGDGIDLDRFGGATDFRQGAAFGLAAVDGLHGPGTWLKDPYNRNQSYESRFDIALERAMWDAGLIDDTTGPEDRLTLPSFAGVRRVRLSGSIDVMEDLDCDDTNANPPGPYIGSSG